MPKYILRRASIFFHDKDTPPCKKAKLENLTMAGHRTASVEELKQKFPHEFVNPAWAICKTTGKHSSEFYYPDRDFWTIEAASIDELYDRYGRIIVGASDCLEVPVEVMIYDSYVE